MHEGSITIRLAVDVNEIERISRLVRRFGELHEIPSRTLYAVTLSLDELISNAILYGYDNAAGKEIVVHVEVSNGELSASVSDEGRPFDPTGVPCPDINAPLDERQIGGLGIHLVRRLMDRFEYQRNGEKNVLTVRKRIR